MPEEKKKPSNNKQRLIIYGVLIVVLLIFVGRELTSTMESKTETITTSQFVTAVEDDEVKEVTYYASKGTLEGTYNEEHDGYTQFTSTYIAEESLMELMDAHSDVLFTIDVTSSSIWMSLLTTLLPILLMLGVFWFFFSRIDQSTNKSLSFGKIKQKKANEERPKTKFTDVAGIDEAVEELQEIKDFLASPDKYRAMGAKIPHGVLLVGPPGTGKTLLARAVAGEAGVPFFSISGSDFVEMFVGVGASRVRDLFEQAKESAPAIIFIDEIDAVGRQRGAGLGGGHDEREQTLNQLLVEMDGFDVNDSVILIAATNRVDILDPALLRPGRFDRQVIVDRPDLKGREQILKVHSEGKPLTGDIDLEKLAQLTPGFTGADLANLMNESALLAARRNKKEISFDELTESMERVIAGPERKSRVITDQERKVIAYHESGHALVGHKLEHADPVHKISIIARGQALGYTLSLPTEDRFLNTRKEMLDDLAMFLGGRVAEEVACDDITTGASNDLERATKMAREMVTRYGMSDTLGHQVYGQPNHEVFLGRDYGSTPDYSHETAKMIDDEVSRIMREAHDVARRILEENRAQLDTMASVLIERETVEGEAAQALLDNTWEEYLAKEAAQKESKAQEAQSESAEASASAEPATDASSSLKDALAARDAAKRAMENFDVAKEETIVVDAPAGVLQDAQATIVKDAPVANPAPAPAPKKPRVPGAPVSPSEDEDRNNKKN